MTLSLSSFITFTTLLRVHLRMERYSKHFYAELQINDPRRKTREHSLIRQTDRLRGINSCHLYYVINSERSIRLFLHYYEGMHYNYTKARILYERKKEESTSS